MIIYAINYGLGVVGPEMAMDSMLGERVAHRQPTARLGTVKSSLVCLIDRKWSMCVVSKILLELDGLNCVKEMLMHGIYCVDMWLNYIKYNCVRAIGIKMDC